MKISALLIGLFLMNSFTAFSQKIEVMVGLNQNNFFDRQANEGHYNSTYESDLGYNIRVGVGDIKIDWLTFRFTLGYDKYGGAFNARDGGLGGEYEIDAKIEKSVLSMGVFPVNFKILNRIDLNLGFEFGGLISETYSGVVSGWMMGELYWSDNLNEKYDRFSSKTCFGLRGRIAYDFHILDKMAISPQYTYYLGLSNEFEEFPEATKSFRHYFCIGFQRTMK